MGVIVTVVFSGMGLMYLYSKKNHEEHYGNNEGRERVVQDQEKVRID